ncbi:FAD-dependent oxidoreductase [Kitasatospora sp. LaBMicrA B282]|uniref:FAD-dependent oxidoreductase n=1 Tax=Kitasatospora sp. LaBMicrA B282 TaxID=3420949 RepID=UPI003D0CCA09
MRIAIIGGGLSGSLLAWRLAREPHRRPVELFTGAAGAGPDGTALSGGLVRGFEEDPGAAGLAAESLAELRGDPVLRGWADYREVGCLYVLPAGEPPAAALEAVRRYLPGSLELLEGAELARRFPLRNLTAGSRAVVEREAGYLSPGRLRDRVVADLARTGAVLRTERILRVTDRPGVRLADGTELGYDLVVLATGAWTPGLLAAAGLPVGGLRTKQIQYSVADLALPGLGTFYDAASGLYGRCTEDGRALLGLTSQRWDITPEQAEPEAELTAEVARTAGAVLGLPDGLEHYRHTVAGFDCYHLVPGLRLRHVAPGVTTFTGGSGGAAKTALAASRAAAAVLAALGR